MTKLKIYSILFAMLLPLGACNKWLDVMPENDQTADEYWQTKEEVEAVLGAGYVRLRDNLQNMIIWGEARGNSLSLGGYYETDLYRISRWDIVPSNTFCKWDKFYQVINYANMVIAYAPSVVEKDPSFSQPVMKSMVSEAYYLRALSYFYLVRNFRDVPLILEPYMNDNQQFDIAKSNDSTVFAQITSDLETALGSSKEFFPEVWASKGRSTKWAIYATLADVYLWTGEYDKCIMACNEVVNSGRVGLIHGVVNASNNWFTMFNPGNSNESIFELQFDYTKGQTNSLMSWFGTNYNYIISDYMVALFQSSAEDIRGANVTYIPTTLKIWKYLGADAGGNISRTYSDQNWIIYRMADINLMKAEALVMKGPDNYDLATELVNSIRSRAGITAPFATQSTELEMLSMVLDEKAREFVAEGKRWYDLLRIAKRDNYKYKTYLIDQVLKTASASWGPIIKSTLQDENSHYLPIFSDELKANKLLVQNPYYKNLN